MLGNRDPKQGQKRPGPFDFSEHPRLVEVPDAFDLRPNDPNCDCASPRLRCILGFRVQGLHLAGMYKPVQKRVQGL